MLNVVGCGDERGHAVLNLRPLLPFRLTIAGRRYKSRSKTVLTRSVRGIRPKYIGRSVLPMTGSSGPLPADARGSTVDAALVYSEVECVRHGAGRIRERNERKEREWQSPNGVPSSLRGTGGRRC